MSEILPLNFSPADESNANVIVETTNEEYDRLLSDLWIGVLLTLMVLSCIVCLCSCFLVHAFRQWQQRVLETRRMEGQVEAGYDSESLPSYTVVAGLPTYEEAIEQLKQSMDQTGQPSPSNEPVLSRLSVGDLLEIYRAEKKIEK